MKGSGLCDYDLGEVREMLNNLSIKICSTL